MKLKNVVIKGVGAYVPPRRISNEELSKTVDTSDEWIYSHTGIKNRHIADKECATSDMALKSVYNLMESNNIKKEEIGAIIVATATQDYIGFPATACIIQEKLKLKKIPAFDIAAGCTGFIYALEIAKSLIAVGSLESVLVIGCEKLSSIVDWGDRNTCVLFGDGSGAALVTASEEADSSIIDTVLHAEGSGSSFLLIPEGGTKTPLQSNDTKGRKLQMEGRSVYNFAVRVLGEVVTSLLERNDLTIDQIQWIVPHQANSRIISAAAKRLHIDQSKFFMNIEEYANTSAASIPIALKEMVDKNLLHKGQLIMTIGFGAGLTYGGNLIRW